MNLCAPASYMLYFIQVLNQTSLLWQSCLSKHPAYSLLFNVETQVHVAEQQLKSVTLTVTNMATKVIFGEVEWLSGI